MCQCTCVSEYFTVCVIVDVHVTHICVTGTHTVLADDIMSPQAVNFSLCLLAKSS
jgi:hypothetical protein